MPSDCGNARRQPGSRLLGRRRRGELRTWDTLQCHCSGIDREGDRRNHLRIETTGRKRREESDPRRSRYMVGGGSVSFPSDENSLVFVVSLLVGPSFDRTPPNQANPFVETGFCPLAVRPPVRAELGGITSGSN